jgi:hypothetical protein
MSCSVWFDYHCRVDHCISNTWVVYMKEEKEKEKGGKENGKD